MHLDKDQRKQVFGLDIHQIAVMVLFGLAVLIMVNISAISLHFTRGTILSKSEVQASFADQLRFWFSSPIFNTITLVAFWIIIGLLAYAVLYWVYGVITEAHNEIVVEKDYVNKAPKAERRKWPITELILLIGLASLAIVTLTILFPIWNSWFISFIFDIPDSPLTAVAALVGALAGMFATIYLFKIFINAMLVLE